MPEPGDRLDSWKEIAAYVGRGVRTVRRWEREEGLPVHRQMHRTLGSVFAFRSEIDAWRQSDARAAVPPRDSVVTSVAAKSIAVLPFTNLSTEPDNAWFADGLTAEVTSDLSRVHMLRVTSRTSAATFRGSEKDVRTIARELGVRYIVEGSVRRLADRLRITADLVDAATDHHLWAAKYDGTIDDVFEFQERLARVIVDALELRLTTDEDRRLAARPIADLHAYECYLKARQEAWRWRKDSIDRAVGLLEEALAAAGDNATLDSALGRTWLQYREAGLDFSDGPLENAEVCVHKAFALEPDSPAGLQLRGWIHYARARIQEAVPDLRAALATDPGNADTLLLLSNCLLISGRVSVARPLIDRLLAIDPLTPLTRCMPAYADVLEGRLDTTIEPYRRMFQMDPLNPMARLFYVWILVVNRRTDEAAAVAETFPADVRNTFPARLAAFLTEALAGNAADARLTVAPEVEAGTDVFPRLLAEGYALAGMADEAVHWLSVAVGRGFINYPFLAEHDPCLVTLRGDPRFVRLLRDVHARWTQFET